MLAVKVYESVTGLHIDIPLVDNEGEQVTNEVISASKFFAIRPGSTEEEEWATTLVEPNILRHTVPEGADLPPGKYKVQPYIETPDGFKGRCETVQFKLERKMK